MSKINVNNEFSTLKTVILGSPVSAGGTPKLEEAYDPKSKEHIKAGTFPSQEYITEEMEGFSRALTNLGIEVVRPETIEDYNQIFSRDIGCVIENKFLIANVIADRSKEIDAISDFIDSLSPNQVVKADKGVRFEGGDVIPHNDYIFIGHSKPEDFATYKVSRTNEQGVEFISSQFPNKTVKAFELNKSDDNPRKNALHLDCCFQPFGLGHAIIHEAGFKNPDEFNWLVDYFGEENCLKISEDQMYEMGANLFSVAPDHIISDLRFTLINDWLRSKGYKVTEIKYGEISKMEGLLRCSTLPLLRED